MVDTAAFERAAHELATASQKIMEVQERQSGAFYGGHGPAAPFPAAAGAAGAEPQAPAHSPSGHDHERRPSFSRGHTSVSSVLRAYEEGRKAGLEAQGETAARPPQRSPSAQRLDIQAGVCSSLPPGLHHN